MADEQKKLTPEEEKAFQNELQHRTESFNAELIPLLKKYELGLSAQAILLPNGTIGARPIIFNDRKVQAESPAPAAAPAQPPATKLSEG